MLYKENSLLGNAWSMPLFGNRNVSCLRLLKVQKKLCPLLFRLRFRSVASPHIPLYSYKGPFIFLPAAQPGDNFRSIIRGKGHRSECSTWCLSWLFVALTWLWLLLPAQQGSCLSHRCCGDGPGHSF